MTDSSAAAVELPKQPRGVFFNELEYAVYQVEGKRLMRVPGDMADYAGHNENFILLPAESRVDRVMAGKREPSPVASERAGGDGFPRITP